MGSLNQGPIEVHRFDGAKLRRVSIRPHSPRELVTWNDIAINEPRCYAGFQEVRPGDPAESWVMWFDEIQYALSGSANLIYRMPPLFNEEYTLNLSAGDLFLLPLGCDFTWEVIGDEPFRTVIAALPYPPNLQLFE